MARPIGTLGTIETLTIGGRVFASLSSVIMLGAYTNATYSTFRKINGTAGYSPSGVTFKCGAARFIISSATGLGYGGVICQSDNDVGWDSATTPTNPVYPFGNINMGFFTHQITTPQEVALTFTIAASKYLTRISAAQTTQMLVWGTEV